MPSFSSFKPFRGFNLKIGTKLAVSSGLGVLLVIGILVNETIGGSWLRTSNEAAMTQRVIAQIAAEAQASANGMMLAADDVRLAQTASEVDQASDTLRKRRGDLEQFVDQALKLTRNAESRAQLEKIKLSATRFSNLVQQELAPARGGIFLLVVERLENGDAWKAKFPAAVKMISSSTAANPEIERALQNADRNFTSAQLSGWQYSATEDAAVLPVIQDATEKALALLLKIRGRVSDGSSIAAVDDLIQLVRQYSLITFNHYGFSHQIDVAVRKQISPLANEIAGLTKKVLVTANSNAEKAIADSAATASNIERIGWLVGGFVILVLVGSAVFGALSIAKPIRAITGVLHALGSGNKQIDVPYIGRKDEVGDAARAANTFRENLIRIEKLEAEQKEIDAQMAAQRKKEMLALADKFQAAVGGVVDIVSSASAELEASAHSLTSTAELTQTLSTTVAGASEQASANVQSVAAATEELNSSVAEISRQVQESSKIASDAVRQAEQTDRRINELSQAASRIGDVIDLITSIAAQTNLLALNATIESARAGEAGRGFAVVATEVKALAAQTSKATEEIRQQIISMQTATQESVDAIQEIGKTIGYISEISSAIAAAVEEQDATTREIARNVHEAAKGTAEVAQNISNVNRGASETGSASAQVLASAQSLSSESNQLKVEVDRFLSMVRAA
jgi:methyl-accepting chemotaxis protein